MSDNEQIQEISLSEIKLDRGTQIRVAVSEETVQRYFDVMEDGKSRDKFPPILLFLDEAGDYWIADGFHRTTAAIRRKFKTIRAVVRQGTKADAIWEAAKANGRNGLQMGQSDIRRTVELIVAAWPQKSNREIADAIGCSHMTVQRLRPNLADGTNVPPEKRVGKDGKSYRAKRSTGSTATPPPKKSEETTAPAEEKEPVPDPSPDVAEAFALAGQVSGPDTNESLTERPSLPADLNAGSYEQKLRRWLPIRKDREKGPQPDNVVHVPLSDSDRLVACLFESFDTSFRERVLDTFVRAMLANDGNELVLKIIAPLCDEVRNLHSSEGNADS